MLEIITGFFLIILGLFLPTSDLSFFQSITLSILVTVIGVFLVFNAVFRRETISLFGRTIVVILLWITALTFIITGFPKILPVAFAIVSLVAAKFVSEGIKQTRRENQLLKRIIHRGKLETPVPALLVLHDISNSVTITDGLEILGRLIGKNKVRINLKVLQVRANKPLLENCRACVDIVNQVFKEDKNQAV